MPDSAARLRRSGKVHLDLAAADALGIELPRPALCIRD
jgi:hypothetical protein